MRPVHERIWSAALYGKREPHVAFLKRVAKRLGADPVFAELGQSRTMAVRVERRDIEVGCGAQYWINGFVTWPDFPEEVWLESAPLGTYARAKFLEGGYHPPLTGSAEFDENFIVVAGPAGGSALLPLLTPVVRRLLLAHRSLWLSVAGSEPRREATDAKLVSARPEVTSVGARSPFVTMGLQRFTPKHCAAATLEFAQLLNELEIAV